MAETEQIPFDVLRDLLARVLKRHGCSESVANVLGANMVAAERDGSESHGIFRMDGYLATLASGWVDPKAEPVVEDTAPGLVTVDAANGFAQPALARGHEMLVEKARGSGVAAMLIRHSHHFAALWPDVEPFAEDGLIALSMVNSMAVVVPTGGKRPVLGTNPVAFASPRENGPPLVFDMATSAMAHGDVQIAAREGRELPPATGVDAAGVPTTDPNAVLEGALLPFGGHKGSAISMMVELLAAGLTGGSFSFEVDWSQHPGAKTPRTGQFLLLIDPSKNGATDFPARAEMMIAEMEAAGVTRLPGQRRHLRRAECEARGIPIEAGRLDWLRGLA